MVIAVPIAVGVALATTVFLPKRLRGPVGAIVDLLAAVPSVVYGLWGVIVLVPAAKPLLQSGSPTTAAAWASWPVRSRRARTSIAGLVLGIMVLPIIAAITREVLLTVPVDQQEAAFGAGGDALGDGALGDAPVGALRHRRAPRRSAWAAPSARRSPSPCCSATARIVGGSLLGPGRHAGQRHRPRGRRGERPAAVGADRPGGRALRHRVHHQRPRAPAGDAQRDRAGALHPRGTARATAPRGGRSARRPPSRAPPPGRRPRCSSCRGPWIGCRR